MESTDKRTISFSEEQVVRDHNVLNKLDILRFTSQVQSRIRDSISEDFILAKLDDKNKEGIIEMTSNAYYLRRLFVHMKEKGKKWEYNQEEMTWKQRNLNKDELDYIEAVSDATFDSFMTRIYMTVILNRNVPKNHLLRILSGAEDREELMDEVRGIKNNMGDLIKPDDVSGGNI